MYLIHGSDPWVDPCGGSGLRIMIQGSDADPDVFMGQILMQVIPQTVLALWGSGVLKAGECMPGFPASWTFPDTVISFFKKYGAGG